MIKFFGEVDRKRDGAIASETPAWAMDRHLGEMKEGIERVRRELERGSIDPANVPEVRERLRLETEKYEKIMSSKPKITAKEKDDMHRAHKELGESIKDSMFTAYDMKKGLASAHEEAKRMVTPIIKLSPQQMEIAQECGVRIVDGKVSRDDATKIYRIVGKTIGENTNVEALRRDRIVRED